MQCVRRLLTFSKDRLFWLMPNKCLICLVLLFPIVLVSKTCVFLQLGQSGKVTEYHYLFLVPAESLTLIAHHTL